MKIFEIDIISEKESSRAWALIFPEILANSWEEVNFHLELCRAHIELYQKDHSNKNKLYHPGGLSFCPNLRLFFDNIIILLTCFLHLRLFVFSSQN